MNHKSTNRHLQRDTAYHQSRSSSILNKIQVLLIVFVLVVLILPKTVNAQDVIIGTETTTTNLLPTNTSDRYSYSQQIYLNSEINQSGKICAISFFHETSSTINRIISVYLGHTTKSFFSGSFDWVSPQTLSLSFYGSVTFSDSTWTTIYLDHPFDYNNTQNLVIAINDNTGSANTTLEMFAYHNTIGNRSMYMSSVNHINPPFTSGTTTTKQNNIIFQFCDPTPMTNTTLNSCDLLYADPGGLNDYPNNMDMIQTIHSDPLEPGVLNMEFMEFSLNMGDSLWIYDGSTIYNSLIGCYTENNTPPTLTATSHSLTFRFKSNQVDSTSGWLARISCHSCESNFMTNQSPCNTDPNSTTGFAAIPFCTEDNPSGVSFPASVGGLVSLSQIGCLSTTLNPTWFFMKIDQPGDLLLRIQMNSLSPNPDVDFACWGPFYGNNHIDFLRRFCCGESELYIESTVGHYPTSMMGDHNNDMGMYPINNLVDCSNSGLPIEYCFIPNAPPDAYYLLLLINNTGAQGTISFNTVPEFTQATTDCSLIALASNEGPVCEGDTLVLHSNFAPAGATFQWSGPNGFSSTLQHPVITNVLPNQQGIYSVVVSANNEISLPASTSVIVYPSPVITFYPSNPYVCEGDSLYITAFGADTYFWENIQDTGASHLISAETPTTFTVIGESNGCSINTSFLLDIKEHPTTNIVLPNTSNILTDTLIQIHAITTGGTPDYYFEWSGTNVIAENNDSIYVPIDSTDCNSIFYFSLTVFDSFGCRANDRDSLALYDTVAPIFTTVPIPFQVAININSQYTIPDLYNLIYSNISDNMWDLNSLSITQSPVSGTIITNNEYVTITVTDPCGNISTTLVRIVLPLSSEVNLIVPNSCNGSDSGVGMAQAFGGVPPYSYSWNTFPTQMNDTAFYLSGGTYLITIIDSINQMIVDTLTVIEPEPLEITFTGITQICLHDTTGNLTIHTVGGTQPYQYLWNTSSIDTTLSNLNAGLYSVTVTDFYGCMDTTSVEITHFEQPVANINLVGNSFCPNVGTISVTSTISGGEAPYDYFWNCNGSIIHNMPTLSLLIDSTNCDHWDTLKFQVIDSHGCIEKDTIYIHVIDSTNPLFTTLPFPIQYATFTNPNYLIPNFQNLVLNNISDNCWDPSQITITQNPVANTIITTTTMVLITLTDPCGNTNQTYIRVVFPLSASITDTTHVSCYGSNNGSATVTAVGGIIPYTYHWSTSPSQTNSIATNLTAGNYTVTITDSLGVTTTATVVITQPTVINAIISGTNVLCNGDSTGSATLTITGATSPYQFLWNNGATTQNRSNLLAGSHSVTVTDAKGCTKTASVTITQPGAITLSSTASSSTCNENNGVLTVQSLGGITPHQYQWSNAIQNDTISNLAPGIYFCTVTDANSCTKTISDTVFAIPMLSINQVNSNPETCSQMNGSIEIIVIEGSEPYQYNWSPGTSTTNFIDNISAGTYNVTVTDQDGCTATTETIIENITMELSIESITHASCGQNNGNITINVESEFVDYTFDWGPIVTFNNNNAFNLYSGTYTVIVNAQDCEVTLNFTIDEIPGPNACFDFEYPYGNGINMPISFSNCTQNGDTWFWLFGDNATSDLENPNHAYFQQGDYIVTLVASNEHGCIDSTSRIITIIGESDIFIPNSFTPNDDGLNDVFIPILREVNHTGYSLKIYNRYGQLIFISYNIEQGWDGKINGLVVEVGSIYSYVIIYENRNGKKMMEKGSVSVFK